MGIFEEMVLQLEGQEMIGIIIAVVIGILLLGLVFKLLKLAIIVALIIGGAVVVQRFLANNNKRIK